MTAEHTRGPWRHVMDEATMKASVYGPGGNHVAEVWIGKKPSLEVVEANALLIDAAPDLAAELLGFVEWAEEHRRQCKAAGERPAIDAHRVARARAALKRAGR